MAEDEGGVSPEVNSSTSQSEDPSLQLVSAWHWGSVSLRGSGGVCCNQ